MTRKLYGRSSEKTSSDVSF
ncbi:hypothetical protein [Xylanivirga thermophila]